MMREKRNRLGETVRLSKKEQAGGNGQIVKKGTGCKIKVKVLRAWES